LKESLYIYYSLHINVILRNIQDHEALSVWQHCFNVQQFSAQPRVLQFLHISKYTLPRLLTVAGTFLKSEWSFTFHPSRSKSRDSSVGIALGYGLDDRGSRVRFPEGAGNFFLHYRVQNGSGAHLASYPMGTRGSFPGGKAAGVEADHSPPSSAEVKECVELYLYSPNMPSWHGA
jgi:hypothetical protein